MALFLASADHMYGPITMLCRDNCLVKHIPWTTFKLADPDWLRVIDARDILGVSKPFSIWEQELIVLSGFQSDSAVLLLREATNPLAHAPGS
jgi:hypothetical protein